MNEAFLTYTFDYFIEVDVRRFTTNNSYMSVQGDRFRLVAIREIGLMRNHSYMNEKNRSNAQCPVVLKSILSSAE